MSGTNYPSSVALITSTACTCNAVVSHTRVWVDGAPGGAAVLQPQVPSPQAAIPAASQQQRHHTTLCWPAAPPLRSCRTPRDLLTPPALTRSAAAAAAAPAAAVPTARITAAAPGLIPAPRCATAEAPVDGPCQAGMWAMPCCAAVSTPSTAQHVLGRAPEADLQGGADPAAVPTAHSTAIRVPGSSRHAVGCQVIKQDGA